MPNSVVKTDGRGILSGAYLGEDRDISRDDWLRDVFPEWGTFLNKEIDEFVVRTGSVAALVVRRPLLRNEDFKWRGVPH